MPPSSRLAAAITIHVHSHRAFSTTRRSRASILFALHALSNSRETQHFNKLSRLSRVEHSPPLKLIKTSEVDTFPCPSPPATQPTVLKAPSRSARESARTVLDEKALRIGRLILAEHARSLGRSQRALDSVKRQHAQVREVSSRERAEWEKERSRLQRELRSAGTLIIVVVAAATTLATWRFWPDRMSGGRAKALDPKPVRHVKMSNPPDMSVWTLPEVAATGLSVQETLPPPPTELKVVEISSNASTASQRSWRSLLWKQ